jgi:hypothetical protein
MASATRTPEVLGMTPEMRCVYRQGLVGAAFAAAAVATRLVAGGSLSLDIAAAVTGVVGMLITGIAVARRPKDSVILAIASATALLALFGTNRDWDAIRVMMGVMAAVAAIAAVLLQLPQTVQRVAISLVVLYHFCGILSAITSPHPMPWLTAQLWARVFRPWLEFCYVNNAYQFYSPQPGPAQLLWFCITDEDSNQEWLKIPRRAEGLDPLGVEYFRRLSLTERANQNVPTPLGPPREMLLAREAYASLIPMHPELLDLQQFRMPNEHARQILSSYARHVALEYAAKDVKVKAIKVYLTQHRMLGQKEFADGMDPFDPTTYVPFFVGEFDAQGNLTNPNDPMLYWIVPIIRGPNHKPGPPGSPGQDIRNYVTVHAHSDPFAEP